MNLKLNYLDFGCWLSASVPLNLKDVSLGKCGGKLEPLQTITFILRTTEKMRMICCLTAIRQQNSPAGYSQSSHSSRIRKKKLDVCSKWDSLNHQVTGQLHASDRAGSGSRAATDSWAFYPERARLPLAAPFENLTDGGLAFWKLAERGLHSNHCWERTVVYTEMFFHGCHSFQVLVTGIQTIRLWWMMFVPLADS